MEFKDKTPFYPTRDEEERKKDKGRIINLRLNDEELAKLKSDMKLLKQTKPSTAIKQVWAIGNYVLHNDKIGVVFQTILDNDRRNQRLGITDPEPEINANVT